MKHIFEQKFLKGKLLKRYKRFFGDIELDGQIVTAHVPNTGSLKSCLFPQQACFLTESTNPERKLKYTLQMLETPTGWVGVNTQIPNLLVKELIQSNPLPWWREFNKIHWEFKLSKETRIDFMLENASISKKHFIEVKNVSFKEGEVAFFPDAVTERGQKHLQELIHLAQESYGAEMIFLIQRDDVNKFSPAKSIDPRYAELLWEAKQSGVLITPLKCHMTQESIEISSVPLEIVWP